MNNNTKINSIKSLRLPNFENDEETFKEERLINKLSLRKKKIQEILFNKRGIISKNNPIIFNKGNSKEISYTKNDFLTGKIYDNLKNAFYNKNNSELKNILIYLCSFLNEKNITIDEIINILLKSDSSYNIINNIKNINFSLVKLVLEIGINTNDKIIYIYCFNFLLSVTYISNDFCKEICTEKIINKIFNKLVYFYPQFIQNKNINLPINELYYDNILFLGLNQEVKAEEAEAYYFGGQILKLLGNLYLSTDNHDIFNSIQFYDKIFYLVTIFILDNENNEKYLKYCYEYLDTLIWLLYIFLLKDEKIVVNYYDKILNIIHNILNYITALYYTDEVDLLEKNIFLLEIICDINKTFTKTILELDGIKILSNLFGYLFNDNNDNNDMGEDFEIKLTPEITDRIIGIFINLFTLDSKHFETVDFSEFISAFIKLFDMYKLEYSNYFNIQKKLLILIGNMACINNIDILMNKIFLNSNIMNDLFKYYNEFHKIKVLVFIDNIMVKQNKKVREFVLDMGGFDAVKNNICTYIGEKEIVKYSIKTLFDIIKEEKAFNIRLLFDKIYNTSIPDKIKEIAFNKEMMEGIEDVIKSLILDFETYEKSLESQ